MTGGRRAGRKPSRLKGLVITAVSLCVLAGVALFGLRAIGLFNNAADYPGPGTGSVMVQVREGDSATAIGRSLHEAGVVESTQAFIDAAQANEKSSKIQVGYYTLKLKMKAAAALTILINPANLVQTRVTVREGERVNAIIANITAKTHIKADALKAALAKPSSIGLPAEAEGNAEGYLFPATYPIVPGETATQLLTEMVAKGKAQFAQAGVDQGAAAVNLTPHQVITLASLLEYEGKRAGDLPKISRVFLNRLKDKMPLQSDATVAFANNLSGTVWTTDAQRKNPSPYNTYVHTGLPPAPIGSPGAKTIDAVLHPAAGPWLYFVPINLETGETVFAATYAEHQRNVARLNDWCRQTKSSSCK